MPNTEATPLLEDELGDQWEDDSVDYGLRNNPYLRYGIYAVCVLIGLPLICFLVIYLPNEAPASEGISEIAVAAKSPVYLHPVLRPVRQETAEYQDADNDWTLKIHDPDDPIKKVPNVCKWQYLDNNSKLFNNHVQKLGKYYENARPVKRLILIGDIHGSFKPLMRLLKRVKYNHEFDQIVMLGDFVAKGKRSMDVLDWAVQNDAGCILGNHEIEVLKRYVQYHGLSKLSYVGRHGKKENITNLIDIKETYDLDDLMRIAKHMTPAHIKYLRECPLIQELGPVPHLTNRKQTRYFPFPAEGYGAHAGLLWNFDHIEDQDPIAVTTMRNLLPPNWTESTEDRHDMIDGVKSQPWTKHWNAKQRKDVTTALNNSTKGDSLTLGKKVYYGHDAHRGVTLREYSAGLDSGCVYGLALSSEVIWAEVVTPKKGGKPFIAYRNQFVQENC
ncbi:hypothetical protein FOA43_004156 [Brettanomyces nanus]|uniref:Calcineurin-like phosphoesterase domain-containing protein n=1 Tax=Eeniella nana TaxID=13502 RepID=A0A875SAE8_EENNA|nr:uncharacterized protein FOA43_004156 [Brettanomyces nanus]QPG76762.1 hypothetical protein FOA43_004156 [Brettanomyces nanus]